MGWRRTTFLRTGVTAHFESQPGYPKGHNSRWFGFEAHGSEGIIALRNSPNGEMYIYRQGLWIPGEENGTWERVLLDEWETVFGGRAHAPEQFDYCAGIDPSH